MDPITDLHLRQNLLDIDSTIKKAEVLLDALPYMQKLSGKTVVIKYGGKAMKNETLKNTVMDDIVLLKNIGLNPVLLLGKADKGIISLLNKKGARAVGLDDIDDNFAVLDLLAKGEYIPVAAPVTDTMAADIAAVLTAEKLIFVTDVSGVKVSEGSSAPIKILTSEQVQRLIDEEIINEGMIPKVLGCLAAIEAGVRRTHIIDGRIPHCILMEMFTHKGVGTMILKEIVPYFESEHI